MKRRILVIDNDAAQRAVTVRALAEEGFVVTAVADAEEALRALDAQSFALMITELHLPGPLDGLAILRRARARQSGLRCLFTAGFAAAPVWDNRDLDDFIAKPFHRRELVGCVFELLQRVAGPGGVGAGEQPGCA